MLQIYDNMCLFMNLLRGRIVSAVLFAGSATVRRNRGLTVARAHDVAVSAGVMNFRG